MNCVLIYIIVQNPLLLLSALRAKSKPFHLKVNALESLDTTYTPLSFSTMIRSLSHRIFDSQQHKDVLFTVSQNLQEMLGNLKTVITPMFSLEPEVK